MTNLLIILQSIFSLCLIAAIILQSRGIGLGNVFGGSGESYRSRRGIEKILFWMTIILSAGFLLTSFLRILI